MIDSALSFIDNIRKKDSFVKKESFLADILFCDHLSVPFVRWVSRFKMITPNGITISALFVSLLAIYYYYLGGYSNLLIGAGVFYIADVLDGVDGKLARKNNIKSEFGAKLDRYSDSLRKLLAIIALVYSDPSSNYILLIGLVLFHYSLNYVKYDKNTEHLKRCQKSGLKSFYEPWDAMFLLLVIGPLFNNFFIGLILTIALQILKMLFHLNRNRKVIST